MRLPRLVLLALCLAGPAAGQASAPAISLGEVVVVSRTPFAGADAGADDTPGAVTVITGADIARERSLNIVEALARGAPGVSIGGQTGNDFEPDVQLRGFVATPLSGAPEGLAVYQDGVRINEAFGDTVDWDFIPTLAVDTLEVITDNPVFGLNALGGAIDLRMKSGFSWRGLETDLQGGSFGRIQDSTQAGWRAGPLAAYAAVEVAHEDGWRRASPSDIRRVYGDLAWRGPRSELRLSVTAADNRFGATGPAPVQLLARDASAVFTTPQTDSRKMAMVGLRGRLKTASNLTLSGGAYYRHFDQSRLDGNGTAAQPCDGDPSALCFGDGVTPARGTDGRALANPYGPFDTPGEIDTHAVRTDGVGGDVQATLTAPLLGRPNQLVAGASLDAAWSRFTADAQLGVIGPDFRVTGLGVDMGASGDPVSDGPVRLRARNTYLGLYALDTLDLTDRLSLTAGGRFNLARLDLDDETGGALSSRNRYDRFNPVIGAVVRIARGLVAYAGYSEANRAPTPLELGCSDPRRPCIIDSFLVSDPPLRQVVSRTLEAGLRGSGPLRWQLGLYRTNNSDDILDVPSPLNNGFGYFANVGRTRRQGLDASLDWTTGPWTLRAGYAFVDATWRSALLLAAPGGDPFQDANGEITVRPGDRMSSIPRHRLKIGLDRRFGPRWSVGADVLWVSSQYYAGDESNQAPRLPGYATVDLRASFQATRHLQVYGLIDNLFDRRYDTFAAFFDNGAYVGNPAFPDLSDPRAAAPGRPLAAYGGVKITF